ncbi:MAG TPA: LysR family transcriptional regulator [Paraburkholderia sp.]|uniref:LysR family transcriptional regulator n=1 Tax=Paraburkholderia sp. TaxID=1926495 RepID=UPI002C1F381C|nr:LysR family transcriptional regulator [Paraburkholderia sp.]HTR08274.1 LysR family transcriptional regulator [Paraburkholderia sp.]
MEFRQLRYFFTVAEHLYVTVAAKRLGIAQPPLSQQILKLERELETKLFMRYPHRVVLTEAGVIFRERAQRVLDEANDAFEHVKKAARGESGHLSFGFAGSTDFHPSVASTLRKFRQTYPGVVVKTEESNSTALLDKVTEGKVDCAMVRLPLECRARLTASLAEEEMVAVLPTGHRLSRQRSVELAQLSADSFVLFPRSIGPNLYDSIISACRAAGYSPRVEMESPQLSSTVNMVAAGFGVTLIPASIRQIHATGVTYKKVVDQSLKTTIALIYRPREKSVTARNFVDVLRVVARKTA